MLFRSDNQLRGRAGRQGDPGMSQFCVSFEDELMVRFGTDRAKDLLARVGFDGDASIRNKMLSSSIESAQKRVEGNNYDIRKTLLEYDDVINQQREIIYERRNHILDSESIHEDILTTFHEYMKELIRSHIEIEGKLVEKDYEEIVETINEILLNGKISIEEIQPLNEEDMIEYLYKKVVENYEEKIKDVPQEITMEFEKAISLRVIDLHWMEHINMMSLLREAIGLRGSVENPLRAYTAEGDRKSVV